MAEKDEYMTKTRKISELLDEIRDILKPMECTNPTCMHEHDEIPEGPWMITGWVLAVDMATEGEEGIETWTAAYKMPSMPSTQGIGLAHRLKEMIS